MPSIEYEHPDPYGRYPGAEYGQFPGIIPSDAPPRPPQSEAPPSPPQSESPSGGGGNGDDSRPAPAGVPQDWADDFIRRNPGDYHRIAEAYASNNFDTYQRMAGHTPPPTAPWPAPSSPPSPWGATFNDPNTKRYEELLQAQLEIYRAQQAEMQRVAEEARARRATTGAAADRLTGYVNERVGRLQGPAYTGSEQEVLRTQLLDPLERDRMAARQRALEQIAARGMDTRSGLAHELLNLVDREFNEHRTRAQGSIASRQIEEQRSREQEAQALLQYLVQLPDAVARGDLDFVNQVQGLINQPGQQGLTVAQLLADLPRERLYDALATLGVGPGSMQGASSNLLGLLQNQQQNRFLQSQLGMQAWGNIGRSFFPG